MAKSKCTAETTRALLAEALNGCTPAQARALLWDAAQKVRMDPTELLGLDVDRKDAADTLLHH